MRLRLPSAVALVLVLSLGGCHLRCRSIVTTLYLGRAIPGGGEVSEAELRRFLDDEVVPRFPDGSTLMPAEGRWRSDSGEAVSERSAALQLIHCADDATDARVRDVISAYRARFRQESVLWTETPARVR
jgi:hypothetical protein